MFEHPMFILLSQLDITKYIQHDPTPRTHVAPTLLKLQLIFTQSFWQFLLIRNSLFGADETLYSELTRNYIP